MLENTTSMKFYNGQQLIRDLGEPWLNIKFEYVVCIFILLGSIVTLGIDDDYDVYRCSKCLQKKVLLGGRVVLTTLDFDINIHHSYNHWW